MIDPTLSAYSFYGPSVGILGHRDPVAMKGDPDEDFEEDDSDEFEDEDDIVEDDDEDADEDSTWADDDDEDDEEDPVTDDDDFDDD